MIDTRRCTYFRDWLTSDVSGSLPADLLDHVANCSLCRGALLLALGIQEAAAPLIDCDECQRLLPEFVETQAGTPLSRLESLPILIHLVSCTDCREIYRLTLTLIAAEQTGTLSPPPTTPRTATGGGVVRLLRLTREVLNLLLPADPAATRGLGNSEAVLANGETGRGFALNLRVSALSASEWMIAIHLSPAPSGWVIVLLGDVSYRAPLLSDGTAQIPCVPAALLSDPSGPALEVAVEVKPW